MRTPKLSSQKLSTLRSNTLDPSKIATTSRFITKQQHLLPSRLHQLNYLQTKNQWNLNYFNEQLLRWLQDQKQINQYKNIQIKKLRAQNQTLRMRISYMMPQALNQHQLQQPYFATQKHSFYSNKKKQTQEIQMLQKQSDRIIQNNNQHKIQNQNQNLRRIISQLQKMITQNNSDNLQINLNKVTFLENQLTLKNYQLSSLQFQNNSLKSQIQSQTSIIKIEKQQIQQILKTERIKWIKQKQKLNQTIIRNKNLYEHELKIIKSKYQNQILLKNKNNEHTQQLIQHQIITLKMQIDKLQAQLEKNNSQKDKYSNQLQEYKVENGKLRNDINNIQKKYKLIYQKQEQEFYLKFTQLNQQFNKNYQNLKIDLCQKIKNQTELRKSIVISFEQQQINNEIQVNQIQTNLESLSIKNQQISKNKKLLQAEIQRLESLNKRMEDEIFNLKLSKQQENRNFKQHIKIMEKNINQLQQKLTNTIKQQKKYKKIEKELENKIKISQQKQANYKQTLLINQQNLQSIQNLLKQKQIQIQIQQNQNKRAQEQIQRLKINFKIQSEENTKNLQQFKSQQIFKLIKQYSEFAERQKSEYILLIQSLQNTIETLKYQIETIQNKNLLEKQQYQQNIKKIKAQLNEKQIQILSIKQKLNQLINVNQVLKQRFQKQCQTNNNNNKMKQQIEKNIDELSQKNKQLNVIISQKFKQKDQCIKLYQKQKQNYKQINSSLELSLENQKNIANKLTNQIKELKLQFSKCVQQQKQIFQKNKEILHEQMFKITSQNRSMQNQLVKSKMQFQQLIRQSDNQIIKLNNKNKNLQEQLLNITIDLKNKIQLKDQNYSRVTLIYQQTKTKLIQCQKLKLDLEIQLQNNIKQTIILSQKYQSLKSTISDQKEKIKYQLQALKIQQIKNKQTQIQKLLLKIDKLESEKYNQQKLHQYKWKQIKTQKKNQLDALNRTVLQFIKKQKQSKQLAINYQKLYNKYIKLKKQYQNFQECFKNSSLQMQDDIQYSIIENDIYNLIYPQESNTKILQTERKISIQENQRIVNNENQRNILEINQNTKPN